MVPNEDFRRAVELIDRSKRVLVTTHLKPDGDACGSVAALCEALQGIGKDVAALMPSGVPPWYEFVFLERRPAVLGEDITAQELAAGRLGRFDLVVVVDTASYAQTRGLEAFLKENRGPVLVIDHHLSSDGLGDVRLVDSTASAAGLIVLELARFAGWGLSEAMAQALFVAVATDTGWFQFANTDARTYRACAELIEAGARAPQLYQRLYQNLSAERLRLMGAMLGTLELHFEGRFATARILRSHFEQTGACYVDTENLVNECHRIGSVEASALLVELEDGRIKCSLRSKGHIDVSKVAERLGGGGHRAAAGMHLPGPVEEAQQCILREMTAIFESLGG